MHEVYPSNLTDFTKQDSIILNIQRAYEESIDLAMHIVSERQLGVPKASRDTFTFKLLQEAGGFLNIAAHYYQALNLDILEAILTKHIDDFKEFTKVMLKLEM
ncbi:DUF86 domain-containing protein [Ureibacillus sp. NPDC094379]